MKFGDALKRAFSALKSGTFWGFSATAFLAMLVPFALGGIVMWLAPWRSPVDELLALGSPDTVSDAALFHTLIGFSGAFLIGAVLGLPIFYAAHGGLVHAADETLGGTRVRVGEAWAFGWKRFFRTLGTDILVGLVVSVGILAVLAVLALFVGGGFLALGRGDNPVAGIGAFCLGELVYLISVFALVLFSQALEGISIRYALVGGRTSGDSVAAAWTAMKARKRDVFLFALIMLGLAYAYQTVTSVVLVPVYLMALPWSDMASTSDAASAATAARIMQVMYVLYPAIFVLLAPFMVFQYAAWGAFFRQLTGLDIPADESPATPYASSTLPPPLPAPLAPLPPSFGPAEQPAPAPFSPEPPAGGLPPTSPPSQG